MSRMSEHRDDWMSRMLEHRGDWMFKTPEHSDDQTSRMLGCSGVHTTIALYRQTEFPYGVQCVQLLVTI